MIYKLKGGDNLLNNNIFVKALETSKVISDPVNIAIIFMLTSFNSWKTNEELGVSLSELFEDKKIYADLAEKLNILEDMGLIASESESTFSQGIEVRKYSVTPLGKKIMDSILALVEMNRMIEDAL